MKSKSKWDKWLLLTWKKAWIMVVAGFVSIMLHNLIYGLFKGWFDARGGDEAFFFILVVIVIPAYFILCVVYSLVQLIRHK